VGTGRGPRLIEGNEAVKIVPSSCEETKVVFPLKYRSLNSFMLYVPNPRPRLSLKMNAERSATGHPAP